MFKKVLVANRGEIAIRIFRALKEMGITSVAVYSDADRNSSHLWHAKEAYRIGPPEPQSSYLSIDSIIGAAKKAGVTAIHPGYGFLAENADFAKKCEEEGITFIGPPESSMRIMGNKTSARRASAEAGIRVVPGSDFDLKEDDEAIIFSKKIGFPLVINASSG